MGQKTEVPSAPNAYITAGETPNAEIPKAYTLEFEPEVLKNSQTLTLASDLADELLPVRAEGVKPISLEGFGNLPTREGILACVFQSPCKQP